MLEELIKKELAKRDTYSDDVKTSFNKYFVITGDKKDKIRKYDLQKTVLDDMGICYQNWSVRKLNSVLETFLPQTQIMGYRYFKCVKKKD